MNEYGFSWPEMLDCGRWPANTDMCVRAAEPAATGTPSKPTTPKAQQLAECAMCTQVPTYENILDHYCRSGHVLKAKIDELKATRLIIGRGVELRSTTVCLVSIVATMIRSNIAIGTRASHCRRATSRARARRSTRRIRTRSIC